MDLFKQGMKGPSRPAPAVPAKLVNRYSPVTNWNDDPFGDVFEPTPSLAQKKKPPPRPPPPKVSQNRQPEIPAKPTHFIRKPTVLSALLSRKGKTTVNQRLDSVNNQQTNLSEFNSEIDANKVFPKCDRTSANTGTLIDFSSPPSSPTFTTRSSSDGVSVDSFGSDATTSTNHHNALSGGNASQAESGFEDDFDLFLGSRKPMSKDDTLDDFGAIDPFSPPAISSKPIRPKLPTVNKDTYEISNPSSHYSNPPLNGPTIIRAKPARPKPPDNSALLKSTFGNTFPTTAMNINTTTPIHKISNGFTDNLDVNLCWDRDSPERDSPEREWSPPMPTCPPPPPPPLDDELPPVWPGDTEQSDEPHAIALFDYQTGHQDDLCFTANSRITLIRRVDHEWMYGRLGDAEGLFPSNYVQVKVPLEDEGPPRTAAALYDFAPVQTGDLGFRVGDRITVLAALNEEWGYGECGGARGQFPLNYVQMS